MTLILSGVHNLLPHLYLLSQTPECFRPERCPHCGVGGLWSPGGYTREADRFGEGENGKYLVDNPAEVSVSFISFLYTCDSGSSPTKVSQKPLAAPIFSAKSRGKATLSRRFPPQVLDRTPHEKIQSPI
jgi:hypothetical protein